MERRGYSICDGLIYKRVPEAQFTSVYCSSVNDFLLFSLANNEVADVLTPHISAVTHLLSQPSCRLIKPIIIDHNIIEVLPSGTCFHIAAKMFKHHDSMKAGHTPRAFVKYEYTALSVPYPIPFVSGKDLFAFLIQSCVTFFACKIEFSF